MALPGQTDIGLLSAVGEPDSRFIIVSSWTVAFEFLVSDSWGDITQKAQGDLTAWLTSNAPSRYKGTWNQRIRQLRPEVERIVAELIMPSISNEDAGRIRSALSWDLLLASIDFEYTDLARRPSLPSRIRECYASGHLPCGFDGGQSRIIAY
jgi:hypothetical protein